MPKESPTNFQDEIKKGNIALFLSPDQIAFIANQWRKVPEDLPKEDKETWANIAFRSMAALHKAGKKYEPIFPKNEEKYYLKPTE